MKTGDIAFVRYPLNVHKGAMPHFSSEKMIKREYLYLDQCTPVVFMNTVMTVSGHINHGVFLSHKGLVTIFLSDTTIEWNNLNVK